jgi:hypothetical protein
MTGYLMIGFTLQVANTTQAQRRRIAKI